MSAARLTVRAIIVTDGRAAELPAVLASLAGQEVRPDIVHLVLVNGAIAPVIPSALPVSVLESDAVTYSDAIDAVLAQFPSHALEYLWLLHDDTAPLPDALAALAATARKRRLAAVVGGAQVRWEDTSKLVNLGTTVSRYGGRRVTMVEADDINQGQYDARDDVLAVSLAAALVRRDVWSEFGGFDPGFDGFGESVQFCRRAWMAGLDVVIVPTARIRHAQASFYGRRGGATRGRHSTYSRRRASEWFHAGVWAHRWELPLLLVWMFLSSLARVAVRIAQNQLRMVGAELSVPWRVLSRFRQLALTRRRCRGTAVVKRAVVRRLLASPLAIFTALRSREMGAHESAKAVAMPTDVIRTDLDAARTRRHRGLLAVVVTSIGASVLLFGTWIPSVIAGRQLTSPSLGVTEFTWQHLWDRTWTGWSEHGFGAPTLDGSFAALMLPLSVLPGGPRLWIGLILCMGVSLAAIAAWFAAGAATRSATIRVLVALTYALWPLYLQSIGDGRLGAVVAHLALPWFALMLARALGWQRGELVGTDAEFPERRPHSPSAAVGAGVLMAVMVVASPVLLVPLVVVLAVIGACAGPRCWRVWSIAIPALVVSGPALVAAWRAGPFTSAAWQLLAREPGPSAASPVVQPWELLVGFTGTYASVPGLDNSGSRQVTMVLGVVVVAAAVVALLSRRASMAVCLGIGVAAVGVLTAVASQRTVVTIADGAGQADANGWAGAGSSLALAGLLGAAAAASHGSWRSGVGRPRTLRRSLSAVALTVVAIVIVGQVGISAWPGLAPQTPVVAARADVLPLVVALEQTSPSAPRVLTLTRDDEGLVAYTVVGQDGTVWLTGRAARTATGVVAAGGDERATPQDLAATVATLVGGGAGAYAELAAWGIGIITVAPQSPRLEGALAQVTDLSLMGASVRGTSYRVKRPESQVPVSRAWFEPESGDIVPLATDGTHTSGELGQSDSGRVVVAVAADPRWHAELDGKPLAQVDDARGRLAFSVTDGMGTINIDYDDSAYSRWWWAAVVVVVWSLLGAIPLHDRRYRVVRG